MKRRDRIIIAVMVIAASAFSFAAGALAHDHDPKVARWMLSLIRPDSPPNPCCGLADGYPVERYRKLPNGDYEVWLENGDEMEFMDGDRKHVRPAWDITVPLIVPKNKINPEEDDLDNPTDTSWLFFRPMGTIPSNSMFYCFVRHPKGG